MRFVLVALALVAGTSAASAEVWRMRYGECGEWRGRWRVGEERSGVWDGIIEFEHVGGPCERGNGNRSVSRARAIVAGDAFFATRRSVLLGVRPPFRVASIVDLRPEGSGWRPQASSCAIVGRRCCCWERPHAPAPRVASTA
jgi:hypothetical protein